MGKTPKIPRNLSDKDMFKDWQEELTLEETMLKASEPNSAARSQGERTSTHSGKRDGAYSTYLSQDAIDTLEKLLLEIKLDLFKQGVADYHISVRREKNVILLEHVWAEETLKKK